MNDLEIATTELVIKDFNLSNIKASESFESFRKLLEQEVEYLINHQFEKLLWILYRIDVSEKKVKEQLAIDPEHAASVITALILEREIQKAKNRTNNSKGFIDL